MRKYVIATTKMCDKERWDALVEAIRKAFPSVTGLTLCDGPNCVNLGVVLQSNAAEAEQVMNGLTMAFMPARWASVTASDEAVQEGVFKYDL